MLANMYIRVPVRQVTHLLTGRLNQIYSTANAFNARNWKELLSIITLTLAKNTFLWHSIPAQKLDDPAKRVFRRPMSSLATSQRSYVASSRPGKSTFQSMFLPTDRRRRVGASFLLVGERERVGLQQAEPSLPRPVVSSQPVRFAVKNTYVRSRSFAHRAIERTSSRRGIIRGCAWGCVVGPTDRH